MDQQAIREAIETGRTALGIELGSTRVKAVLIGPDHSPIAGGDHGWENRLENGVWTYSAEQVWEALQSAFAALQEDVRARWGTELKKPGAMGVSAMMHGFLPFDRDSGQLCEFRTWRNTITEAEAAELTELFHFNIPQRWSIAHLWRAVKNGESFVPEIARLTTLAGYVHWRLTGEFVLGVGDASGMFPIDSETGAYHAEMTARFDQLLADRGIAWRLEEILPQVLPAGAAAGELTAEGARLLDPSGTLEPGVPFCPPEGDAGTGMAATNSVSVRTGNVSAGTSIFAMAVLERPLKQVHPEIDMVTTPDGLPVAMVHCNTCTSDLNEWVGLFGQALKLAGRELPPSELYELLYRQALSGDADCGGLVSYNCYSGEPVAALEDGRPLFLRRPDSPLELPNFMRALLYASFATLQMGMDILFEEERISLEKLYGHGGLFKTRGVAQRLMAGALNVPVCVMETAGEGGPWGMALLAAFRREAAAGESLPDWLAQNVFGGGSEETVRPDAEDRAGFARYMEGYRACLSVEREAARQLS